MTGHRITYTVKLDGQSLDAGSAWDDDSGSGYKFYEYGTESDGKITGVTASDNGGKAVNYKLLTESNTRFGEANPWQTKDYVFQINDDLSETFLKGVRVEGNTTITLGRDRVELSVVTNTASLPEVDTNTLQTEFVDAFLAGEGKIFYLENPVDSETTRVDYFNTSGTKLGSIKTTQYAGLSTTDVTFENSNGDQVGSLYSDQYSQNFNFGATQLRDGVTVFVETTDNFTKDVAGQTTFSEKVEYVWTYDIGTSTKGTIISGIRTVIDFNGKKITEYGAGGEVTGVYDGEGNVLDPYALFDFANWTVPQASLDDYAANVLGNPTVASDPQTKQDFVTYVTDYLLNAPEEPSQIKDAGGAVIGLNVKSVPYSLDVKGTFTTFDGDGMPTAGTIESMEVFSLDAAGNVGTTLLAGHTTLSIKWTDFVQLLPAPPILITGVDTTTPQIFWR